MIFERNYRFQFQILSDRIIKTNNQKTQITQYQIGATNPPIDESEPNRCPDVSSLRFFSLRLTIRGQSVNPVNLQIEQLERDQRSVMQTYKPNTETERKWSYQGDDVSCGEKNNKSRYEIHRLLHCRR